MKKQLLLLFILISSFSVHAQEDDASFTLSPTCDGCIANVTGTIGGTFTFNPVPTDGAIINAQTGTVTNATADNTYIVQYTTNGNFPNTSMEIFTVPIAPIANQPSDIEVCDTNGDGFYDFNLHDQDAQILSGQVGVTLSYYSSQTDADNGTNALVSPYTNTVNPQVIYASVTSAISSVCPGATTSFNLVVNTVLVNASSDDLTVCDADNDGFSVFDLTSAETSFTNGDPSLSVGYYETFQDALGDTNPINNPSAYNNISAYQQVIYIRVSEPTTGCFLVDNNVALYLNVVDVPFATTSPLYTCDDNADGFALFDFSLAEISVSGNTQVTFSFFLSQADAVANNNPLNSSYTNVTNPQIVYVRVTNDFGCISVTTLDLIADPVCSPIASASLESCTDDPNILAVFDLTNAEPTILNGLNPAEYTVSYFNSQMDADNDTNAITNTSAYQNQFNPETIYVRVDQLATGSIYVTTLTLTSNLNPQFTVEFEDIACDGDTTIIQVIPAGNQTNLIYQWSFNGITLPSEQNNQLFVTQPGNYDINVLNLVTGCTSSGTAVVAITGSAPSISTPTDLTSCAANTTFDLTTTVTEIANGADPSTLSITFYETQQDAVNGTNQIQNPNVYTAFSNPQTIYVAVYNSTQNTCAAFVSFNLIGENCPATVTCGTPVNNSYCYNNNETTQYTYTSSDGSPLQVVFNSGQVENNFDELILLDSDGVTNMNTATPYGNGGDVSNLSFISSGDTITLYVDSDGSVSCQSNAYDSLNYTVSCIDVTALPDCNAVLITPQNGATNVSENVVLTWSAATGIVTGYKISIGTTPGGTDITNALDIGNVLTYTPAVLSSLTDYFVTIIPYNTNGDGTGCSEQSFTTREVPNPPVGVTCASGSPTYLFTEDFETDEPSGWTGTGFSGNNGNWDVSVGDANSSDTGPFSSFNGNSHLEYEASGSSTTIASITSQDIDLTNANSGAELSFYMHAFGVDVGTLNVNVTNASTGVTETVFTWSGQYQESDIAPWLPIGIILDAYVGSVISIELSYGAAGTGFKGDMAIDYLRVQTCGSFCIPPSDITVTNITETTADVSWTANSNETEWEYVVQPVGTGEPTGSGTLTNTSTLTLTGLIGTTDYEIYIRSNCGVDGFSLWSLRNFTTTQQTNFTVDCVINLPVNTTFCYENNETLQYTYTSSDGSPLLIVFNSGNTENNFDALIVLDSDGITNLNADNPYGNSGDLTGLTFTTTGSTATVYIQSDGSVISCTNNPIDFDVFCGSNIGFIEVNAFLDYNNDGVFNGNDTPFTNGFFTYEINNDGNISTVNSNTGSFTITNQVETNSYDFTFAANAGYESCFTIPTALFENITVANGSTLTIDFPVIEQMPCEDLGVYLIPFSAPRPGFNYWNDLIIENLGSTTITSGTVTFIHDPIVNYVDATIISPELTVTQTATGATVDFTNLLPGEMRTVWFKLYTPPTVNLGEFVTSSAVYTTAANDVISDNNVSVVTQEVIGSYDPNDITESHGRDIVYNDFITTDEYLYYTIRFQNVGTAEAINVRIENTVDPLLDVSTLEFLRATHDVVMMQNGNQLTWTFDNIYLPAQSQDDFGSNGYVHFKIKPTAGYAIGTIIPNTAEIYFDFNAAVVTNTFETEFITESLSVEEFASNDFIIYPNPANDLVNIKLKNALDGNTSVEIIDVQGKVIIQNVLSDALEINVKNLEAGLYFVKLKNNDRQMIKKLIIE